VNQCSGADKKIVSELPSEVLDIVDCGPDEMQGPKLVGAEGCRGKEAVVVAASCAGRTRTGADTDGRAKSTSTS
jgi:hypothetical protein